ncbi:MAG: hypothetical protein EPN97_11855 [Alphaproteobacteria bacterium]|nr:MAG: hypothetical protein EPN97_11855 [Alphaproteobacteria bacterium]
MAAEWYGAHVITSFRPKKKTSRKWINVWETIYLVKGRTPAEALRKAEKLGKFEAKGSGSGLTINGKPGKMVFEGIRKLMLVMNPFDMKQSEDRPDDGTDITHSDFGVRNQAELKKLVRGKQVTVEYYEYGPPPMPKRRKKKTRDH